MRALIATCMRNEAPFLLEWIAYNRHIGFTDFLIYSNDCEDGTDAMLDRLQEMGVVTHEPNPSGGKKSPQWRALSRARNHEVYKAADWVFVADVDEFLCIHAGDGRLADLFAARADADGFAVPWRMFGNGGVVEYADVPLTSQFTRTAPEALLWPWRAVQFKSLYRNDARYTGLGVHRPKVKDGEGIGAWVDGNGDGFRAAGTVVPTLAPRYALAQINHYALGSIDSFLVKAARGKANHTGDPIDLAYWMERNFSDVEDTRILRHGSAIADGMAALREDAEIDRLHRAGVTWRHARIAELVQDTNPFYLRAQLLQAAPTRVLPPRAQRQLFEDLIAIRQRHPRATPPD